MVKITRTFGPLLIAAGLLLAGCNFPQSTPIPTFTPALPPELSGLVQTPLPADDSAACVAGSWQMRDLTPILNIILPAEVLEANQFTLTGTGGMFRYTFTNDGAVKGSAENYQMLGETKRGRFTIPVTGTLNGQGTGSYAIDDLNQEIVFTNLKDLGFSLDIAAGGIPIMSLDSSQLGLWFGGQESARTHFECSGQTLMLSLNVSGQEVPVTLDRINP